MKLTGNAKNGQVNENSLHGMKMCLGKKKVTVKTEQLTEPVNSGSVKNTEQLTEPANSVSV